VIKKVLVHLDGSKQTNHTYTRRGECELLEDLSLCKVTDGTCCTPEEFAHCIIHKNVVRKPISSKKEEERVTFVQQSIEYVYNMHVNTPS
jgi:hypothetical protein